MALQKHILTIDGAQYVLPVPPSSWEVIESNSVTSANVLGFGEINTGSKPNLKTASVSSFFPTDNIGFIPTTEFKDQYKYIEAIKKAKNNGTIIEYMITDTDVYMYCLITAFTYGERDYSGDIYYTLELKEDKSIELANRDGKVSAQGYVPNNSQYPYVWTVAEGDTLLKIAKKAYGDSSQYTKILSKNGLTNVNQIKAGDVLYL